MASGGPTRQSGHGGSGNGISALFVGHVEEPWGREVYASKQRKISDFVLVSPSLFSSIAWRPGGKIGDRCLGVHFFSSLSLALDQEHTGFFPLPFSFTFYSDAYNNLFIAEPKRMIYLWVNMCAILGGRV